MSQFYIVLNFIALLALIAIIIKMQRNHVSFSKRVFTALGLGILLGAALQLIYGVDSKVLS